MAFIYGTDKINFLAEASSDTGDVHRLPKTVVRQWTNKLLITVNIFYANKRAFK